jgi:hypothetical protein
MQPANKISDTPSLQESVSQDFCFNKKDVKESETALRIIQIIEMKISKNKETPISNAYDCFSY